MLRINGVRSDSALTDEGIKKAAAGALGIPEAFVLSAGVFRRSIDARHGRAYFVYSLLAKCRDENAILARGIKNVSAYTERRYAFPFSGIKTDVRPLIVGMGPAGLFCALALCRAGIKPVLIDRGRDVDSRGADVERFWKSGALDAESNVQFGEGGAGTFSDGKLTTGINDERINWVFRQLVSFGAPEDILWLSAPHVGTDRLKTAVKALREELIRLGCTVMFETRLEDIETVKGAVRAAVLRSGGRLSRHETSIIILAPGNGARDTFEMLSRRGVSLAPKSFSVGVRIEHSQSDIDIAQYGSTGAFPPASYKLAEHLQSGRSVYSFCVCPGGSVVAAASEPDMAVTNGMSLYARGGKNINGALLVGVSPEDYPAGPLGGIELQRKIERAAYSAGGGGFIAPAQRVGDFLRRVPSAGAGRIKPTYRPGVRFTDLWNVLPDYICVSLAEAIPLFGRRIRGFDDPDAILTAAETRSSSPVRILRGEDMCSVSLRGLYPCGEGAGYAGGITSSAVDGVKCAEAVAAETAIL